MKNKLYPLSCIALCMVLLLCCSRNEYWDFTEEEKRETDLFFDVGVSSRSTLQSDEVQCVVNTLLKQNQLIRAVRKFKAEYGMPMWTDAISVQTENGFQAFVPILHQEKAEEIIHIWNFCVRNDTLYHIVSTRNPDAECVEKYWKYDYFTIYALKKTPRSGLQFEADLSRSTYKCVHAFVETEWEGKTYTEDKGWHCWEIDEDLPYENTIDTGTSGSDGDFGSGVPVDPGSGGGGYGSAGSGGGESKANAIFRNRNMIAQNWEALEGMVNKIIKTCMGEKLYNELKSVLDGKKLSIQFTNEESSSFFFDGSAAGIKLSTSMESNHLLHEMWHAYQAYQETTNSYKESIINLEIEAHYAQYLYLSTLPEFKESKWEEGYQKDKRLKSIKKIERYLTSQGEYRDKATGLFFEEYFQYTVIDLFKKENTYKDYKYNESRVGISNFKNLIQLTKDCLP